MDCLWSCKSTLSVPSPVSMATSDLPSTRKQSTMRKAPKCILGTLSAVTFGWIAGHIGHLWNELANAAAKQTAHDPATSATSHVGNVDPLLTRRQLDWFFLARLAPTERLQYPPLLDGAFAITNHEEVVSNGEVASMLGSPPRNVRRGRRSLRRT